MAPPTPEMPSTGVTMLFVNIAQTNACSRPIYTIRGIIKSILRSLIDSIIAPNEECNGSLNPFSSLLDSKHNNAMPTIMQPRNTTNKRFFPVTLPPSFPFLSRASESKFPMTCVLAIIPQNSPVKFPKVRPSGKLFSLAWLRAADVRYVPCPTQMIDAQKPRYSEAGTIVYHVGTRLAMMNST